MKTISKYKNIQSRLILIISIFFNTLLLSQTYPVQVTPQLIPPYSLKLSDYTTATNEKLYVNVLLNDVNEVGRRVRLKMYIEGQGLTIASKNVVLGERPVFIDGGINMRLSNIDLQPYFQLNNLTGITLQQYNSPLPNGGYDFCFEVYDYFTNRKLSGKNCTTAYLLQNDPPILNLPFKDNIVAAGNPQNILFTWTPRHSNASNVQYEYTLKELWDTQNPQASFLASIPFYQTTTYSTTLLVGPEAPQLLSGKIYGWQVRAFVSDGINETSVFKNDGRSEIFWFKYLEDCRAPGFVISQALTAESVQVNWQISDHIRYKIEYRKKGFSDEDWFHVNSYTNEGKILNLEADTVYEFRVGGECTLLSGFAYSNIQEFTTPTNDEAAYYNCGLTPKINISNNELLPKLGVNETFTAGDFPVITREITGSNGTFSGWGYITLPFLENFKEIIDAVNIVSEELLDDGNDKNGKENINIGKYTRIKVLFSGVTINTSYELIKGVVETDYDPDWKGILDVDEIIEDVLGDKGDLDSFDASNISIDNVTVGDNGKIIIHPTGGKPYPIETKKPTVITDKNGTQWTVDESGKVTKSVVAKGGVPTKNNTEGISSAGNVTEISSKDVSVKFIPSGYYSTDTHNENITSDKYKNNYEFIKTHDNKEYTALYKLVSDIAGEETDVVKAKVTFANGKTKDDIVFKTIKGGKVNSSWVGNVASLSLKRQFEFAKDEILATVKPKDSTKKHTVAGKLNIWHAQQRSINLTLVSVDGASTDGVGDRINEIYNKAGVNFNITSDSLTLGLKKLDVGDSDMISNYTQGQKNIISTYKNKAKKEQYYIFFLDKDVELSKKNVEGFMPLKRQFGFVFTQKDPGRVAAHEIGHGIFGLKHPWDQYNTKKGESTYLMDSGTSGTDFTHMDWQKLHAPGIQLYIFQGDEDGQHESYEYYASRVVVPGLFVSNIGNYSKNTVSFISTTGKLITLPTTVNDVTFHKNGQGTLFAFTLNEGGKKERYVSASRDKGGVNENFAGYLKKFDITKGEWKDNVYQDKFSVKASFPKTDVEVYLGKLNNKPCGINLYKSTTNNTTSGEWNSGGNEEALTSKNYITGATKINEKIIESSAACNFCDKGKEFFELHADIKEEKVLSTLRYISDLICSPDADTSFFDEFSKNKYDNLLAWQKTFYDEGLWKNDIEAYKAFYEAYKKYIQLYKKNKSRFQHIGLFDREQILKSTFQFSNNQLKLLTAKERAGMLRSILDGQVGGFWTGGNYNVEALVLNIIKTVNNEKESNQVQQFLDYLVDENYKVGDNLLYKQLVDKVNNSFFGTDTNRLTLISKLTELSLIAKGINLKENLTLTTNQGYETLLSDAQCKGDFYWDVTDERFLWLFNVVNDKSKLEFDFISEQKKISLKQFCTNTVTNYSGNSGSTVCNDWKFKGEFDPFELVALNIINDLTFTKGSGACENSGAVVCGKVMLVPAMFIDYLDREKGNKQFSNSVFNTLTVASFYFSGSSIIAARGALTVKTFPAYADLFVTIANPYFSDDTLFVAHATSVIKSTFFDVSDETASEKSREVAKLLQTLWTIGSIPLTLDTATSIPNVQKHIEAIATYKALVRKLGSVEEAKKVIANSPDLAEKVSKGFNAAENNLRTSSASSKLLDEEIGKKLKKLDDIIGNSSSIATGLMNSLLKRLEDGSTLKQSIKQLDAKKDQFLIGKIFDLSESHLNDFNKIINSKLNVNELDDLFRAWKILIYKSPKIAKIPENSIILAKVADRFSYGSEKGFKGLDKLFNQGSKVGSKQKLINHLEEANKYFEDVIPIEFSAIKKGDVKITIIDKKGKGAEVGRYVDGILQKKKILSEAEGASVVKKADNPNDDILQKGENVGFRKISDAPSKLVEGKNIIRGSSTEYSLAKKRLKEYIEGEIYKIKKSGLPKLEQDELIKVLNKKNKAYMEGNIGNLKFDGNNVRRSGDTFEGENVFSAYKVDKNGGINTQGSWIRNADTEYVMLSEIAKKLGAKRGGVYKTIKGEIKIVSELPYCASCQGVIQDFSRMFPNVKIVLIDKLKY